jgi:hypothetical protein
MLREEAGGALGKGGFFRLDCCELSNHQPLDRGIPALGRLLKISARVIAPPKIAPLAQAKAARTFGGAGPKQDASTAGV